MLPAAVDDVLSAVCIVYNGTVVHSISAADDESAPMLCGAGVPVGTEETIQHDRTVCGALRMLRRVRRHEFVRIRFVPPHTRPPTRPLPRTAGTAVAATAATAVLVGAVTADAWCAAPLAINAAAAVFSLQQHLSQQLCAALPCAALALVVGSLAPAPCFRLLLLSDVLMLACVHLRPPPPQALSNELKPS